MEITKEMQEVFLKKEGIVVIADATGEKRTFFISPLTSGDSDIYRVDSVSAATYLWNINADLFCTINKATKKIMFPTSSRYLPKEESNLFTEIGTTLDASIRLFDEMMRVLVGELFSENGDIHQEVFDEWKDAGFIPSNISESIGKEDILFATKYTGSMSTYLAVAPEQRILFWIASALFQNESSTLMEAITWCDKNIVRTSLELFCSFCKEDPAFYSLVLGDSPSTKHMQFFHSFLQTDAQFPVFYDLLVFQAAYRQTVRMQQQEWLKIPNLTKNIAEFQKKARSIDDSRLLQHVQYQFGEKGFLRFTPEYYNLDVESISPIGVATGSGQYIPMGGIYKIKYGNKVLFSAE